jgi:hypothetical protein
MPVDKLATTEVTQSAPWQAHTPGITLEISAVGLTQRQIALMPSSSTNHLNQMGMMKMASMDCNTIQMTTLHMQEMSPTTGLPKMRLLVSVQFNFMSWTSLGASMPSAMRIATNMSQMP